MRKNISFFAFLAPLFLLINISIAASSWQWINGQRVQSKINEGSGLWLIDVRNSSAYEGMHIEGSVNIPAEVLAHKKFPSRKTLVLVDDSLGQKSAREAADKLVKNGHERVSVLEGGITGWKIEKLPLVERNNPPAKGVTAAELKWALAGSVPMKIYDLRDEKTRKKEPGQNSESVSGKTLDERVENVKKILTAGKKEKKKSLAARMQKMPHVVLVFSAHEDAAGFTRKISHDVNGDIRYLIGGYEAMISDRLRGRQKAGSCPTCPGGKSE